MSRDYTVEIDGYRYHPVPESWIDHPASGDGDFGAGPRVFAVSVAVVDGDRLRIRYSAANGNVYEAETNASRINSGLVPSCITRGDKWPRSQRANRSKPREPLRLEEWEHFWDLWSDRLDRELQPSDRIRDTLPASGGGLDA